jgi:hypothetical protein
MYGHTKVDRSHELLIAVVEVHERYPRRPL